MSIFSGIENVEHTFAGWAEKELSKLYKDGPKIEQVADTVLQYVGPALQTIITLEAGAPAGAIVSKVIQDAQSSITAASGVIYDFGASPSAASIIHSVKSNLASLLSAGHVTNPASVAHVNQVINELDILITALGNTSPAAPTSPSTSAGGNAAPSDTASAAAAPDDPISEQDLYPVARRLIERCDAVLRIEGASKRADEDVRIAWERGFPVYFQIELVPRVTPGDESRHRRLQSRC